MFKKIAVSFALMLAGCATTPAYIATCPPLVTYSPAFERQAADQLAALPAGSPLVVMTSDYIALRAAVRACRK